MVVKSKTASVITLTLQLPTGERIPSQFPSNFSVWQILRQYESGTAGEGRNLEITQRGYPVLTQGGGHGHLMHEMPSITIVQRELSELEDFKKTLSQLGFTSGPILLRLNFRKTNVPLHEAMEKVSALFADQESDLGADIAKPPTAHSKPSPGESSIAEEQKPIPKDELRQPSSFNSQLTSQSLMHEQQQAASSTPASSDPKVLSCTSEQVAQSSLQPTHVFSAPTSTTPAAARLAFNESAYVPTVEHAHAHQQRLQESGQNKRLLSDRELEAKNAIKTAHLNAIQSVEIRVRFPDNTSADWTFGPQDTGARVYEAVRIVLRDPKLEFYLAIPPNSRIRDAGEEPRDLLIKGYELKGKVLLNMVLEGNGLQKKESFIKSEFSSKAETLHIPNEPPEVEDEEKDVGPMKSLKNLGASVSKEASSAGKKLPKWFKMGKR